MSPRQRTLDPWTHARVDRVLALATAVIDLLEHGQERERIHELVDRAVDEWLTPTALPDDPASIYTREDQ